MSTANKLPEYATKLFCEIYDNAEDFVADYKASGLYLASNKIADASATTLFYLLWSQYGNNPIANYDETQFKYKMWTVIFKYGPSWEKKLDIQSKLRGLTEAQIRSGSHAIHNHAYNPSTAPKSDSEQILDYINEQNTSLYKKSEMDAYMQLWDLLANDVTSEFVNKFKVCFKMFVQPARTYIYETDLVEDEDED